MKKQILLSCALAWAVMAGAETIDITTFRYAGPYVLQAGFCREVTRDMPCT